jgi:NAD+ synthase (glutamine-hydrolysing)
MYIEQDLSVAEIIAQGYEADTVKRVAWLVDINEYKRRQSPPGVRVTQRAFGKERRYPITSGFKRH